MYVWVRGKEAAKEVLGGHLSRITAIREGEGGTQKSPLYCTPTQQAQALRVLGRPMVAWSAAFLN